jgi:hypothetical protein
MTSHLPTGNGNEKSLTVAHHQEEGVISTT